MRLSAVLHFTLLLPLIAGASPQQPVPLPDRIDAEVAAISGFNRVAATPRCDDGEFLRRVMLDLVGCPPNAEEARSFVADPGKEKREAIVDRLLASDRFGDFWAHRWMDAFFGNDGDIRGEDPEERDRILGRFHRWLAGRIRRDGAWTETVHDLLIADGTSETAPALAYKLVLDGWPRRPYFEGRAVSHFMGLDLSCTGCHDHPFDSWRVDDGFSLGAFSNGRKIQRGPRGLEVIEGPEPQIRPIPGDKGFYQFMGEARRVFPPLFLHGGKPAPGEVLARAFARLMVDPKNVQFRSAFVNRVWSWLMGRGIVMPVDDFNLKNKPVSPSLLRLLGGAFAANGHSLKMLVRTICATQAYQRRCDAPTEETKVTFSRAHIRPLSVEQLVGSLEVATLGKPTFDPIRVRQLAERMSRSRRPACDTTTAIPDVRALAWLADGEEVWSLLREGPVVKAVIAAPTGTDRVNAMFLAALSREPSAREIDRYSAFLKDRGGEGVRQAYWTLLNSTEFLTRH